MDTCRFQQDIERWFDGDTSDVSTMEAHVKTCPGCAALLKRLEVTREAVRAVKEDVQITDAQLPHFMKGIQEGIAAPSRGYRGRWALASTAAAAIVVAVSLIYVVAPNDGPIGAETIIEEHSTDIDGATTESFVSDDGTANVWVNNIPDGDML